jgi:diaminopimelate epimerase
VPRRVCDKGKNADEIIVFKQNDRDNPLKGITTTGDYHQMCRNGILAFTNFFLKTTNKKKDF